MGFAVKDEDLLMLYLIGSAATFALAAWLWHKDEKAEAAATILLSPFPCPPGLPC